MKSIKDLPPEILKEFIENPAFFSLIAFDVWLWSKQREIVNAIKQYDKIAIYSATGTGKSFLEAIITIWFLQTRENNLISLISPNYSQLMRSVWRVVLNLEQKSRIKLLGNPTKTSWEIKERNAKAEPLSYRRIETIQGIHEEHMLFILEESSGLDDMVWDAVYGNMTGGKEVKLLAFGNPLYPKGEYYRTLFDPTFHKIKISIFDTPNFSGEIERIPEPYKTKLKYVLPNERYVEDAKIRYGEGSNFWKAKVLGEFPEESEDGLFNIYQLTAAMERDEFSTKTPVCFTIDVAREGTNSTVIAIWKGYNLEKFVEITKNNFSELANYIVHLAKDYNPEWITLDTSGMGIGLYDILSERKISEVYGVQFHEPAVDSEIYANTRTEMYFNLSDAVKNGNVKLIDEPELKKGLMGQKYTFDKQGRLMLIDKEKLRKKLGKATDYADAVALRFVELNKVNIAFL